jgi:hypothetical protein
MQRLVQKSKNAALLSLAIEFVRHFFSLEVHEIKNSSVFFQRTKRYTERAKRSRTLVNYKLDLFCKTCPAPICISVDAESLTGWALIVETY